MHHFFLYVLTREGWFPTYWVQNGADMCGLAGMYYTKGYRLFFGYHASDYDGHTWKLLSTGKAVPYEVLCADLRAGIPAGWL